MPNPKEEYVAMFGTFTEKFYPDGVLKFEGNYKNGKPNGYGKAYYPSGKLQYEGMWANGVYHGEGTLYSENSSVIYSGEWLMGIDLSKVLRELLMNPTILKNWKSIRIS